MNIRGIGVDTVEISRFKKLAKNRDDLFFTKTFTSSELDYCFSFKDPAPHLAGSFAAKEAVAKALDASKQFFGEIEIRHTKTGAPVTYKSGKKMKGISVSITHTKAVATAVAIAVY